MKKILNMLRTNRGSSLIEVLLGVILLMMFAFSLYTSLIYILNILSRSAGLATIHAVLNERVEYIKNLNYVDVGVSGGVPSGVLPSEEYLNRDERIIKINFYVRNIDDPFDGVVGGAPNDTAPADYKLVELHGVCEDCPQSTEQTITVRIAPRGLENSTGNGALFINVFNATGDPVKDAQVTIQNNSGSSSISISDVTDIDGFLRIIDTPTSTEGYEISVTKAGYSTDATSDPNDVDNPNPIKPHATVASGQITSISFSIDAVSKLTMSTTDYFCQPVSGVNFSLDGTKLIGTSPNILKFSTTSAISATGTANIALEWDNYQLTWSDPSYVIAGLTPYGSSTFTLNPGITLQRKYVVASSTAGSALITVIDSFTSDLISQANITLTKSGEVTQATSGIESAGHTDWSSNNFTSKSGIDVDINAGSFSIEEVGGVYPSSTSFWLTSKTLDFGTSTIPTTFGFSQKTKPAQTDVLFQIASNNDNSTWNFTGPDGSDGTFYTVTTTISSDHNNKRYFRYKSYLSTEDENATPEINGVTIYFSGGCVPTHQKFFDNLDSGTYDLLVQKSGYEDNNSSISVNNDTQEVVIVMTPN